MEGVAGESWSTGSQGVGFDLGLPELDSTSFAWNYELDVQPGTLDLDNNGSVDLALRSRLVIPNADCVRLIRGNATRATRKRVV